MPNGDEGIANFVQRGEIRVGGLRMCLFEITAGFYSIRESLDRTIGPATSTLLYQAGVKAGRRFVTSASRLGMIKTGYKGLADCIDIYSQAGFGNFKFGEEDYKIPHIVIECCSPESFEAFAHQENQNKTEEPVCDYSRGVISGFFQELNERDDILCVETECIATGSTKCVFEIGPQHVLISRAIGTRVKV